MSKECNFRSLDSLKPVQNVVNDASEALKDPKRTVKDSTIPDALGAAGGAAVGGGIGFAALYYAGSVTGLSAAGITSGLAAAGGIVGGGMVAGIAVLAAPIVILGVGGYVLVHHRHEEKLK